MKRTLPSLILCSIALTAGAQQLPMSLPAPLEDADFGEIDLLEAQLGQLLFYDPILSGNQDVACATCHHPAFGTSDGVPLAFGDGGIGLGPDRQIDPNNAPEDRIPRNAPALFNLGAKEFTALFHDGRLEIDPNRPGGIRTPMDSDMVLGFASLLSAQTMFPVLSRDEMAGSYAENDVARLVRQGRIAGTGGAWDLIAHQVSDIPEYAQKFQEVYPHISAPEDIVFTDISNAIAIFMAHEWRSDTSPFDAVLRGELTLEGPALTGLNVFYGHGECATCHTGALQTDHQYHAMGAPQIGPGKAATFESHHRDEGRFRVTGNPTDRFAFRTPSLRNVALTAPYGHAGATQNLAQFIADHADPVVALHRFDQTQVALPDFEANDFAIMTDPAEVTAIAMAVTTQPINLSSDDVTALIAFLNTLTDPITEVGRLGVPESVPSGLNVPNPD